LDSEYEVMVFCNCGSHVNLVTKPGQATIARLNRTEGR
jgi:hypothetical protein